MYKKKLTIILLLMLIILPIKVNATDYRNKNLKINEHYKSGDIIGRNGIDEGNGVSRHIPLYHDSYVKFFQLDDDATRENREEKYNSSQQAQYSRKVGSYGYTEGLDVILPTKDGQVVDWELRTIEYSTETYEVPWKEAWKFYFYETWRNHPEVRFDCKTNKVPVGNTTSCKIIFISDYELNKASFVLSTDILKISNVKPNTATEDVWTVEKVNGTYKFAYQKTLESVDKTLKLYEYEVGTMDITNNRDDKDKAYLYAKEIKSKDALTEELGVNTKHEIDLSVDGVVKEEKPNNDEEEASEEVENPKTGIIDYTIVAIVIIGTASYIYFNRNKLFKKI